MKLRRIIGVTILALWVVAVAFHVRREYFRAETVVLAEGARALAPGSHFYSVQMDGRAIGLASSRLDTLPDGFRFDDLVRLEVPALDRVHTANVQTRARLGPSLELRSFDFRLESEIGEFHVAGEAEADSTLVLRVESGPGGARVTRVPMGQSLTLPVALPLRLAAAGRLAPGEEYTAQVFDPSAMSHRPVTVRVTGRDMLVVLDSVAQNAGGRWVPAGHDTIPVWVVEESYGGVSVRSWLDEDGRLVRAESPMGFTLIRMPYEAADQAWVRDRGDAELARGYGAVIENTAVAANADLSELEGGLSRLVVRLENVELEGFDLQGGRQGLRGDTLRVTREPLSALQASYQLPYSGEAVPDDALESTALIQADAPELVAVARRVAGGSRDAGVVARRLNEWVYERLEKDVTLSVPSALQVLEAGQGDCNEHTVLYVALARALGLPARTAVGLVFVNGQFYYHAWPEVWLDGWVAMDPTLGQVPADASHLRFLIGGLARQVELIRLIGRLQLDILEAA